MDKIRVDELIEKLQSLSPEAFVEFEVPRDKAADREPVKGGDRVLLSNVRETFYNAPENKWVVLT